MSRNRPSSTELGPQAADLARREHGEGVPGARPRDRDVPLVGHRPG